MHAKMNGTKLVHLTDTVKILNKNFLNEKIQKYLRNCENFSMDAKCLRWKRYQEWIGLISQQGEKTRRQ